MALSTEEEDMEISRAELAPVFEDNFNESQLQMLLEKYQDAMSDVPGRTDIVETTTDVGNSRPISQYPYTNFQK